MNKQTNNYIMQDHAKQKYIFCHLSLIRNLAFDIPRGAAIVRDVSLKKEIRVPFGVPLFSSKWYGAATYFSLYKK